MSDDSKVRDARETVPHEDPEYAKKGASSPAPIPPEDLPNRDKELKKAQAVLMGQDPDFVDLVGDMKESKKLIKVAKGGRTISVHPDTLDAHFAAGWRISAEDDNADELREFDAGRVEPKAEPKKVDKKSK